MKESISDIKLFLRNRMDWFEEYKSSALRLEVLRIIQGVFEITNYLERSPYVEDYVIKEFGCCVKKMFKYIEEDLIDTQEKLDDQIFSINEWNTASKERKLSILSFVFAGMSPQQTNRDDYEHIFKQFDEDTLEWLKNNTPYEEVKESLAYHYCKEGKNE